MAAGLAAFLAPPPARSAAPARFTSDPFALGVASGDPSADGVVLWTRLCPDPLDPDGLGDQAFEVGYTVAADPAFRTVVRAGRRMARPERAHSVHVDLYGLEPDRDYWYRFDVGGATSRVGRAVTLPAPGAPKARLKLAWASCQHYEAGLFTAYRDMIAGDPRLILHVGDYLYEGTSSGPQYRRHPNANPRTLAQYRSHHAVYKTDPDLQAAHRHTSWAFVWDDHEVANDYAGLSPENPAEAADFPARRAAAYQAYLEHLPISRRALLGPDGVRLYQRLAFGDLVDLLILDTRQYRAPRACVEPSAWRSHNVNCAELTAAGRTVLGEAQERWLGQMLTRDPAKWTGLVQTTMFARLFQHDAKGDDVSYQDTWDGYPAARQLVTDRLVQTRAHNPVFLGGDVHCFFANDVRADFSKPDSPVVATEFVGTSITSPSYGYAAYKKIVDSPENNHIHFYDDRKRGYGRAEITPQGWSVDLRAIESVWSKAPVANSLARFHVEPGRPGAQPA
jgi:alkaline phosphatase D